jgi:hypothetical protein
MLNRQTRDSSNETEIILYKANQNKSWNLIPNQPNVEWWNWKKKLSIKKDK